MFKITPVQDFTEVRELTALAGIPYIEGAFLYKMFDMESGEVMGISQFEIHKDHGELYALVETDGKDDFEAMFILGRQTLNFIDLCGMHRCVADACYTREGLLCAIGFQKSNDGVYSIDLTGMFDGHCANHEKKDAPNL